MEGAAKKGKLSPKKRLPISEGKIKGHGAKRRFFQSAHRVGLHMGLRPVCRRSALRHCLDCGTASARRKTPFSAGDGARNYISSIGDSRAKS